MGDSTDIMTESRCSEVRVVLEGDPVARDPARGWLGRVLHTVAVLPDDPGELSRSPPFSPDPSGSVIVTGRVLGQEHQGTGPRGSGTRPGTCSCGSREGVTRLGGLSPRTPRPRAPRRHLTGTCPRNQELPRPQRCASFPGVDASSGAHMLWAPGALQSHVLLPPQLCFSIQTPGPPG